MRDSLISFTFSYFYSYSLWSDYPPCMSQFFSEHQKDQLVAWSVRAILANDFYTDDSFVVLFQSLFTDFKYLSGS